MRILFVTNDFLPHVGGLEILVDQLMEELSGRGHQVALLTSTQHPGPTSRETWKGCPLVRSELCRAVGTRDAARTSLALRELRSFAEDFRPDVVHAHDVGPLVWLYRRIAGAPPPPLLVTLHIVQRLSVPPPRTALLRLLAAADWVTGVSQAVVDDVVDMDPSIAGHVSVVPNGLRVPLAPSPLAPDGCVFLALGRLVPHKRVDVIIDAMAIVASRRSGATLLIAGDGVERPALEAIVARSGLQDAVRFLGNVGRTEVYELIGQARALVIASEVEGMPLIALEAAAGGRPVIAHRSPGISETVLDGVTGLLVDSNVDALAAAMLRLAEDPGLAAELGRGAADLYAAERGLEQCVDRYEALYDRLTAAHLAERAAIVD